MLEFFLSIAGFVFSVRIIFRTNALEELRTIKFLLLTTAFVLLFLHPLFIGVFLLSLIVFVKCFQLYRQESLDQSLILFLDLIILSIKSGRSLKFSIDEVTSQWHHKFQRNFFDRQVKMYENPCSARDLEELKFKKSLPDLVFSELFQIKKNNSAHLDQISLLRKHLKIMLNLRRRSGQASQQAKAQAIIIFLLYFGLLLFMRSSFGWKRVETFFVTSLPIMIVGIFIVFRIARSFKWKI